MRENVFTLEFLTKVAIIVYHCYSASDETVRFSHRSFHTVLRPA